MHRPWRIAPTATLLLLVPLVLTACQPVKPAAPPPPNPLAGKTVLASGLRQPRQIVYGSDGTLFIAENGNGGNSLITTIATDTVAAGLSSQVTAVAPDGKQSVILAGIPSVANNPGGGNYFGAQGIYVTDDSIWIGTGYGPELDDHALPFSSNLIEFDRKSWRIKNLVDVWAAAAANGLPEADGIASNPSDIAVGPDGTVYVADASANALWSWRAQDGLKLAASWTMDDNPVPTGVAVGPDGDVYVSMLSGFPFSVGDARIERWSNGALKQTYDGLTMLTDVLVTPAGELYAVQFAEFGDKGPIPGSGKVIKVTDAGAETVLDGLIAPYAVALAPDGTLAVSVLSAGDGTGNGAVIKVE